MSTIQEFNYLVNIDESILFQYNQATNLVSLITQKQNWYDLYQSGFWDTWYNTVFNLVTAELFGLAVWSIILNIPLYVTYVVESDDKPIFGLNAYDPSYPTLENSYFNFYGTLNGETSTGANFSTRGQVINLTEEEQRFLLRLRYYQLTTLGSICSFPAVDAAVLENTGNDYTIEDINTFLNYLCTDNLIGYTGTIYVLYGLDMTITYVFTTNDFPTDLLEAIFDLDVLPRPAGVGIRYVSPYTNTFGLNKFNPLYPDLENNYQNFYNGNFHSNLIV